ncbi:MAG: signal peptidase I [Thermomicrobiales bacterium]|nr:signal peptidase I [Thermomicrobiales bacterium]
MEVTAPTPPPPTAKTRSFLRDIVETAIVAILIYLLIHSTVLNFVVEGSSMQPTLQSGDRILVNRNAYGTFDLGDLVDWLPFVPDQHWFTIIDWGEPERGDVIVLTPLPPGEQKAHIKRVIGLPGDHVQIIAGEVIVNGTVLDEEYIGDFQNTCNGGGSFAICDVVVPEDSVFVMGDHRNDSADSRYFDVVPYERIIGKAWLVYWPVDAFGMIRHPDYPELTP